MTNHGRGNASMSDGVSVLLALVGGTCPRRRRLPARRNADEIDARIWRAPSLAIVHEDNRKTRSFDYTANTSRKIRAAIWCVNFCATTPRMSTTFSTSQIPASRRLSRRHAGFLYNHHEWHALATLFYTQWDDALLVTAACIRISPATRRSGSRCAGEPGRRLGFEDVRRQAPVVDPAAPATSQISAPRRCRWRICKRAIESGARRKSAD